MSWYSCNVFYPEWKVWEGYVTDNLQSALSLDSLRSSHPIEVPVKRADEINQVTLGEKATCYILLTTLDRSSMPFHTARVPASCA